jgi:SHS2 domain-containing protein
LGSNGEAYMNRFEILPHTADVRLKVTGDSLEELFTAALEGMNNIIKNDLGNTGLPEYFEKIKINSTDESMLIIDFLSEVLTLSHKNKVLYNIKTFDVLEKNKLEIIIEGNKVDGFDEDIKAVTYTEAEIIKNSLNEFETIIVFDI